MPLWQEGERIRADCESMHLALKTVRQAIFPGQCVKLQAHGRLTFYE